jgi:hypothetical protein
MVEVLPASTWRVRHFNSVCGICFLKRRTGDVSLSAEDKPPPPHRPALHPEDFHLPQNNRTYDWDEEDEDFVEDDEMEDHSFLEGHTSLKFLFAGGVAGAGQRPAFSLEFGSS